MKMEIFNAGVGTALSTPAYIKLGQKIDVQVSPNYKDTNLKFVVQKCTAATVDSITPSTTPKLVLIENK